MKTIYKYPLDIDDSQTILIPKGSKILSAVNIKEQCFVYAIVDTTVLDNEYKQFEIVGTGHLMDNNTKRNFLGTVIMQNGSFVAHVFEVIN